MPVEVKLIRDWAVVGSSHEAPEVKALSVRGTLDGRPVLLSGPLRAVGARTYSTPDGRVFQLDGPPEAGYAEFCQRNGFELDPADPIKFRASPEEFKWNPDRPYIERVLGGHNAR